MNILNAAKHHARSFLERSPRGYQIGKLIVRNTSFGLPHEEDFYGLQKLARKAGGLFLDLGANDGISARSFHKLVPAYQIFSVEANPFHEASLRRLEKSIPGYRFVIGAAGETEGEELTLYTPVYGRIVIHSPASTNPEHVDNAIRSQYGELAESPKWRIEKRSVKTLRVDSLGIKPDLVKIDLEGAELMALRGMSKTLAESRPHLMVEYSATSFSMIAQLLKGFGYRPMAYRAQTQKFEEFASNSNSLEDRNCFFLADRGAPK